MATWKFSNGVEVDSGGIVRGGFGLADALKASFSFAEAGDFVPVPIAPPPGGDVALDVSDDWLLDRLLRAVATREELQLTTDYVASDDNAPAAVRDLWAERADDAGDEPTDQPAIY